MELLTKAQEALNKDAIEAMQKDCLTEKARDKLKGMMKYENSPLDIDTAEQQYKTQEYGNMIKVTPKCAEDVEKAKKMQDIINYYMSRNEGKMKDAMAAALLDGFNMDPDKYLKNWNKPDIIIPTDEIKRAIKKGRA